MKKERREITEREAFLYASEWYDLTSEQYEVVTSECESSDVEDGGGHYRKILKDKVSGQFFEFYYCDWDIDNTDYDEDEDDVTGRCDLSTVIGEVFPSQVIKIEYT